MPVLLVQTKLKSDENWTIGGQNTHIAGRKSKISALKWHQMTLNCSATLDFGDSSFSSDYAGSPGPNEIQIGQKFNDWWSKYADFHLKCT